MTGEHRRGRGRPCQHEAHGRRGRSADSDMYRVKALRQKGRRAHRRDRRIRRIRRNPGVVGRRRGVGPGRRRPLPAVLVIWWSTTPKADGNPVAQADREGEQLIEHLACYPDNVLGEEYGEDHPGAGSAGFWTSRRHPELHARRTPARRARRRGGGRPAGGGHGPPRPARGHRRRRRAGTARGTEIPAGYPVKTLEDAVVLTTDLRTTSRTTPGRVASWYPGNPHFPHLGRLLWPRPGCHGPGRGHGGPHHERVGLRPFCHHDRGRRPFPSRRFPARVTAGPRWPPAGCCTTRSCGSYEAGRIGFGRWRIPRAEINTT